MDKDLYECMEINDNYEWLAVTVDEIRNILHDSIQNNVTLHPKFFNIARDCQRLVAGLGIEERKKFIAAFDELCRPRKKEK